MNGFLLLSIHNFDDIPVEFFNTYEEAMIAAKTRPPAETNSLGSLDITGFVCFKILEFRNNKPFGKVTFVDR